MICAKKQWSDGKVVKKWWKKYICLNMSACPRAGVASNPPVGTSPEMRVTFKPTNRHFARDTGNGQSQICPLCPCMLTDFMRFIIMKIFLLLWLFVYNFYLYKQIYIKEQKYVGLRCVLFFFFIYKWIWGNLVTLVNLL